MRSNITLRSLFIVSAAICFAPGVCLVLAPGLLMSIYGLGLDDAASFVGRILGAVLLGLAVIFWRARQTDDSEFRRSAVIAGLVLNGILTVIIGHAVLTSLITWTGWPAAALHLLLFCGFGYVALTGRLS